MATAEMGRKGQRRGGSKKLGRASKACSGRKQPAFGACIKRVMRGGKA